MNAIVETDGLAKRFGRRWALQDCTLEIPAEKVVALVGANGAGKTTFLNLAVGLLAPTSGTITVLGEPPDDDPAQLGRIGFVAQEAPVYARLSVADHLRLGAWLNPTWDARLAEKRVALLGLDARQRAGSLSGGERAQLALTLAVAKRPELLLLDEPLASLDPLARREFLQGLMEFVAGHGASVVLSSHVVADLERVCDYVIVLVGGRVQVAGDIADLLASHHRLSGARRDPAGIPANHAIIEESHVDRQTTLVIRADGPIVDPSWTVAPISFDDLVLAYMRQGREVKPPAPDGVGNERLEVVR